MKYFVLKIQFLILVACCLLLIISFVQAAVLYLEPSEGDYQPGDTFLVEIKIDTEEECINVVEANLSFSQDILYAIDFSQGESILTLWVKTPTINQDKGEISFIGGIPGNYCGRIRGDPGPSNLLGKIIFRVPGMMVRESKDNVAEVKFLDSSQVLLSDKLGTKAKLTTQGAKFKILAEKLEPSKEEWQEELEKDKIPPEPFEIKIHQEPSVFEGKYFIIFSTTDKQTGIDHYEISETRDKRQEKWKVAQSPYTLKDQALQSIIKVKAVDKAGNETITEYISKIPKKPFPYLVIILVLIGAGVIWYYITKLKRKNTRNGHETYV